MKKVPYLFACLVLMVAWAVAQSTSAPSGSGQQSAPAAQQAQPPASTGATSDSGARATAPNQGTGADQNVNGANGNANGANANNDSTATGTRSSAQTKAATGPNQGPDNTATPQRRIGVPWWWIALGLFVLLVLIIALVSGRSRSTERTVERERIDRDRIERDRTDRDDIRRVS
jgi:hypothetical protein